MSRLGVLLMTYGSPADAEDMPRYLAAVRGGRAASEEVVAEFRRRYALIGGSPLIGITTAQAAAVEAELRGRGIEARAGVGMRFSPPTIAEGLARLGRQGCRLVVGIIMSPQHSVLLMDGYRAELAAAAAGLGPDAPAVVLAPAWHQQPGFLAALAQRIAEATDGREDAAVLLTAHSLPRRVADREPAYLGQLRATAEAVARLAGLAPERWRFCWQSAGHEPGEWMKPDFSDVLPELARDGFRRVVVAPVQFLADHLEILYDVDVGAREQAEAAGLQFSRIESLNTSPPFMSAMADIAVAAARHPGTHAPSEQS